MVRASADPQFCFAKKDSQLKAEPKQILRKHLRLEDGNIPFSTLPAPQLGRNSNSTADVQQQQSW